jgi:H2-forming N5,N10-methylenetetrahydromethanopterin dehydrogenase-like enzyme
MTIENLFENASRKALRFPTERGMLSVEQLWQLPLTGQTFSLDGLAKAVNKELRESSEESFVTEKSSQSGELEIKLEILKHIIAVRKDEAKERERRLAAAQQLKKIDEIIESKEDDALRNKSPEELRKLREELMG